MSNFNRHLLYSKNLMKHIDLKLSTLIERWGERHVPSLWHFGAAYAILWFFVVGVAFIAVMPVTRWLEFTAAAVGIHVATLVVQFAVRRDRPVHHRTQPYRLWLKTFSFPSAHASSSFGSAVLVAYAAVEYLPSIALPLIVVSMLLAVYIASSRVLVGVHFLGDVVTGAIFGSGVAVLFASFI